MDRRVLLLSLVVAGLSLASPALAQLAPPPGPVQATDRTRINQQSIVAFPYFIGQPGSYVLTSNLTGVGGAAVIAVGSNNVTIDLNGFTVSGGRHGIEVLPGLRNVTITNGTVSSNSEQGIEARFAEQVRLDGVRLNSNGVRGAYLGDGATVLRSTAESNTSSGFRLGNGAVVTDSSARNNTGGLGLLCGDRSVVTGFTATGNGQHGIASGLSSTVENCVANTNGATGAWDGVFADFGSTIRGCAADNNTRWGIVVNSRGNLLDSSTKENGKGGITVGYGTTVQRCTAHDNGFAPRPAGTASRARPTDRTRVDRIVPTEVVLSDEVEAVSAARSESLRGVYIGDGISTGDGCTIVACDAQGNADAGIAVAHSSTVIGCTVRFNGGGGIETLGWTTIRDCTAIQGYWHGIDAGESSTVENCTLTNNQGSGLTATSNTAIRRCTVNNNGLSGIEVTGTRNRVEENQAASNLQSGFSVTGLQNLIVRNSASGNPINYNVFPGNNFGNVQFLFGGPFFSNEPWANFEY
ncbi:MAG: right-handed parallel beta-helix repeat-containing protein [Phycisphaerae bacterium]|nr:right-handed parallel beta-helix repeat-containing protein [Phycisphaerae bacterium]